MLRLPCAILRLSLAGRLEGFAFLLLHASGEASEHEDVSHGALLSWSFMVALTP